MNTPQQITQRCIERPSFDNTHLASKRRWISDNTGALARYFKQLTKSLPAEELTDTSNADLDQWLSVQYELELLYQDRARKVAAGIASIGQKPTPYQPTQLSEHEAEEQHHLAQAKRLK